MTKIVDLTCGKIQGSVQGTLLYAIYLTPLFDLTLITNFADDNFIIKGNSELIENLQRNLEIITKWLKDSGLTFNDQKLSFVYSTVGICHQ